MNDNLKKGIYFDLDTGRLKEVYKNGDWHNAYYELRSFLEKEGFEHIQGSGYHSINPMLESKAMDVVHTLTKKFPWLNECVKVCTIADVPKTTDITHVFAKEAEKLKKVKYTEKDFSERNKIAKKNPRSRSR